MKIYTRTGDAGETGLFGGGRVSKADPRVVAYGTVDELNAVVGLAAVWADDRLALRLRAVQARLFDVGADLATPLGARAGLVAGRVQDAWIEALEAEIDGWEAELAPLAAFILPGGSRAAAGLHVARAVCRRTERRVVALGAAGVEVTPAVPVFLNRLSDWLFTAARLANARAGIPDTPWTRDAPDGEDRP